MRKLLLITTAIIGFALPDAANAAPVIGAISFLFGGAGFGAITSIWGISAGTLGFAALSAALRIGVSLLLSAAATAIRGKPKQADVVRDLMRPTSLPPYRYVYGQCRAPGSPAPVRVKGKILYGCYILNSRPSAGPFTVYLDKRVVEVTGNPYDFSGTGASATNAPFVGHAKYWIGRGDQVSPPAQILSEAGDIFQATDGWRGLTVIWVRFDVGKNSERLERWPGTPPEVMVDGKWSMVADPRSPAAPDAWSANQALCTLDALRRNPLRIYDDNCLWLETFAWAADVADEPVAVVGGGAIPRYEVNGVLVWSEGSELEDQVLPLAAAGASRMVHNGGRLGIIPGTYSAPVMTLDDVLTDNGLAFSRWRPSSDLITEISAQYVSPERQYEDAETPAYIIPGAQAMDGGVRRPGQVDLRFVTDHRQAQRVAKIIGLRSRMQRSLSGVFPPKAFDMVGGSVVTVSLPSPYTHRNGVYEVEEAHPALDPVGQSGMAMRVGLSLRETSPDVYAWTIADEKPIAFGVFEPNIGAVQVPGVPTLTSDASTTLISGDSSVARVRFVFAPSASQTVVSYEWQYKQASGLWQQGGIIDRDIVTGGGDVFGHLVPVVIGTSYTIRVRALAPGSASEWVESAAITASAGAYLAPAPTPVQAIGGAGEIAVTFQAPNDSDYRAMDIWGADVDDSGAAVQLFGPIYGAANVIVTEVEDGLGSAVTRYYFARSRDRNGSISPFSASISATTT